MSVNTISYNGKQYADDQIESATGYQSITVVGDQLPYDTFEADVWDYSTALLQYCANDQIVLYQTADELFVYTQLDASPLTTYIYAAPVSWVHRGQLVLQQYLKQVTRIGKYKFRLSCVSGVGLIVDSRHYGGLYDGIPFSQVLADIVGGAFQYSIDEAVAAIIVYGWLPIATRQQNLRQLLESSGAVIRTTANGLPWFAPPATDTAKDIEDSAIYLGGSVEYPTPYKAVKITEHAYAQTAADLLVTLFDGAANGEPIITPNGASVVGALVTFSDPMHGLEITGGAILESGVNYAVLAPSVACQLTGYKYSHTQRVVTAGDQSADEQATKRVEDCTLINMLNSEAVAQRWLGYYSAQKTVTMPVVWHGEQPADAVSFSDPYDEASLGIIEKLDVRFSAKIAADAVVQTGNIPSIIGNFFQHVMVVTQSGMVTTPPECKGKIQAVMISGGQGGWSGLPGANSAQTPNRVNDSVNDASRRTYYSDPSAPAAGGASGKPGSGGRVYIVTMEASPGQQFRAVIGLGGKGGEYSPDESVPGSPGGDTEFAGYSSADGETSEIGYIDAINGVSYALPGSAGVSGGNGGGLDDEYAPIPAEGVTYNGVSYSGGSDATSQTLEDSGGQFNAPGYGYVEAYAEGGFGGGAAVGNNGNDGSAPVRASASGSTGNVTAESGLGGHGADAVAPLAPESFGTGGTGGHGGGGAGSSGLAYARNTWQSPASGGANLTAMLNDVVPGGKGSDGGPGAPGVLLIYY